MCRNIRPLFNFEPPATEAEIRASALQYVRKVSGYTKPSQANQEAFDRAVEDVAAATRALLESMVTNAPPKDRESEAERARERARNPNQPAPRGWRKPVIARAATPAGRPPRAAARAPP